MNKKEYIFSCIGELEDLIYLRQLFMINGVDSNMEDISINDGEMGLEEVLIASISSTIIPSVLNTINIWIQSRKKELKIVDKKTGKEIYLTSNNGKGFSDSELEKLYQFFG